MYKKIRRPSARKLFEEGKDVYALSCKMRPDNMWMPPIRWNRECGETFDALCNAYHFYNCNRETGEWIGFYVKEVSE